jgi:hypothetical protein
MILSRDFTTLSGRVVASVATLMYHGSHPKNKDIILSQGLIPNPKKRKWQEDPDASFYQASRQSLSGIYLTTNLLTATSSGSVPGGGGWGLLVVVLVQSGSLLADEDDVKFRLNDIALPGRVVNEWTVMHTYSMYVALQKDLVDNDRMKQEMRDGILEYKQNFIDKFIAGISYRITMTKQEISLVRDILEEWGFFVALKRMAAHLKDMGYRGWGSSEVWGVEKPDVGEAEVDFKRLEDRLSRVLKRMGRPEYREENAFNVSARIETPISYSGKNRIIAVIEVLPYQRDIGTRVKVLYPPSGEVPEKLIQDWEKAQGPWRPVTNQV